MQGCSDTAWVVGMNKAIRLVRKHLTLSLSLPSFLLPVSYFISQGGVMQPVQSSPLNMYTTMQTSPLHQQLQQQEPNQVQHQPPPPLQPPKIGDPFGSLLWFSMWLILLHYFPFLLCSIPHLLISSPCPALIQRCIAWTIYHVLLFNSIFLLQAHPFFWGPTVKVSRCENPLLVCYCRNVIFVGDIHFANNQRTATVLFMYFLFRLIISSISKRFNFTTSVLWLYDQQRASSITFPYWASSVIALSTKYCCWRLSSCTSMIWYTYILHFEGWCSTFLLKHLHTIIGKKSWSMVEGFYNSFKSFGHLCVFKVQDDGERACS